MPPMIAKESWNRNSDGAFRAIFRIKKVFSKKQPRKFYAMCHLRGQKSLRPLKKS
jgi:hypothetical protein